MTVTGSIMADASKWLAHTTMTDPADFRAQIAGLRPDIAALSKSVQRLLVHTDCLALYGLDANSMTSRTTLPVHERLSALADLGHLDFAEGRPPAGRQVGTCRDFALLLCSFLRVHDVRARVRCGFASYFGEGWSDHWICEHWDAATAKWLRADAELDTTMCEAYGITFDTLNMPPDAFLTAGEAWRECRNGRQSPEAFGHGEHRGLWFMSVNLARDSLSLNGREMSPWDSWREVPPVNRRLPPGLLHLDELARHPERFAGPLFPPWLVPSTSPQDSNPEMI